MVEKNKEYIVEIIDNGYEGEGIAKIDGFTIFIQNTIKGEKVKILIVKVLSSHAFAKVIEILVKSSSRVEPDCTTYKRCGGCNLRHCKYEKTLEMKENMIQSLVNKYLSNKIKVNNIIGMENPTNYRNKVQYPVGIDVNNNIQIGVFANRTHEIIPIDNCLIQNEVSEEIAKYITKLWKEFNFSVYNEKTRKGDLRHIVIKAGFTTCEYMCILVLNNNELNMKEEFTKKLLEKFPNIKTIVLNINTNNTNVILGNKNINIYGDGYIYDKLDDYTFKISPLSFYQVNPVQTKKLYNLAVDSANISKEDIVFDLYSGIGTISIFMAKYAKEVYGIEIVEEAVQDAKENAKINNIKNTKFLAGDTSLLLDDLINNKNIIPDILMIDPPRKGLDQNSVQNILKIIPKKIVYISCNPATLVRDISLLEDVYNVKTITPVDMFPYTNHVETCTILCRKK